MPTRYGPKFCSIPASTTPFSYTAQDWVTLIGFRQANLSRAQLGGPTSPTWISVGPISVRRCHFSRADLARASLRGSALTNAMFVQAYLGWADLTDADFTDAVLDRAEMSRATMMSRILKGAIMPHGSIHE